MSYPLSSAVSAGDPTEADQYNNLRLDAIYLGNGASESGTLLELLNSSMGNISLSRTGTAGIRLNASAASPCGLMISGRICSVTENQTLTVSTEDYAPGKYNLYAVGTNDGSFTLEIGTETPAGGRKIGSFIWTGSGIIPGTLRNEAEEAAAARSARQPAGNGRVTLASGNPYPSVDISDGQTLYFTPCGGSEIGVYTAGGWENFSFEELSLSISGLDRNIPYDVFIRCSENGLRLETERWSSVNSRSVPLNLQNGIRVSGTNPYRRYLGTFALNASGYGEDSQAGRLVWNENNRISRGLLKKLTTTLTEGTAEVGEWIPYYNDDAPEIRLLVPNEDTEFNLEGVGIGSEISEADIAYQRTAALGIAVDMAKSAPYTGNRSSVPVYTHTYGNSPLTVKIQNGQESSFIGLHTFTLAWWTNYNIFRPNGTAFRSACGEAPGLVGMIRA